MLVVLSGPPGVGKTTLARELARSLGAPHVRVDAFETALGLRDGDGDPTGYRLAHVVAGDALRSGRHAVVDAVNPVRAARDGWRSLAVEVDVPLLEVDVTCSDPALHERRVRERTPDLPGQRVPTWADVTARHPWQRDADEPGAVVVDTATTALARSVADLRARAEATPRQVAVPASLLAPTHRLGSWAARGEPGVVLTTERLLLRRWRETDLEPFAAMGRDPDVMAHLPGVLDRAASDGLASYADACFEAHGFGLSALERRSDGAFLGFCGLARHRRRPDQVEVGWRLARSAWGHGYATEAARAWLDAAGRVHGLTRVECYVAVDNARSLAVAARLGLLREFEEDWDGVSVVVHATPRTSMITGGAGVSRPRPGGSRPGARWRAATW